MLRLLIRLMIAVMATGVYLLALRFVVPSSQPYFMFSVAIVGLWAWLLGTIPALLALGLLIPVTNSIYQQFTISTSYASVATSTAYLGIQFLTAVAVGYLRRRSTRLTDKVKMLSETNDSLQGTLLNVQEPGGIHYLCGQCKSIQDDAGIWYPVAVYLKKHTKMDFSHCICPDCAEDYKKSEEKL